MPRIHKNNPAGAAERMNEDDLKRMSRSLRHRLRNMASGLRGALSLIEQEAGAQLPPGLLEYFPLMLRECDALQDMAHRFSLLFDHPAERAPVRADEMTERVLTDIRARFSAVDIRWQGHVNEGVSGWAEQALIELLVNACEAAPNGVVGVQLRLLDNQVIWLVSDSGPGADAAQHDNLFAPFYTTRPRHLGIGLPIARRLCEMAGGTCRKSEHGGSVTDWSVEMSCATQDQTARDQEVPEKQGSVAHGHSDH